MYGVDVDYECYCGNELDTSHGPIQKEPANDCHTQPGIFIFRARCSAAPTPPVPPIPEYHGCLEANSSHLAYCNLDLSYEQRAKALVDDLTLDEKIALLSPTQRPYCAIHTPSIPHADIPKYKWLTETNSCPNGGCVGPGMCPTVFIGPTGVAASFNRTNWWLKGDVVSTDLRVLNNYGISGVGLSGFGPNINMVKDPRWGGISLVPYSQVPQIWAK